MTETQIKKLARTVYPDYKGRKISFGVQTLPIDCNDEANWGGGTKTYYKFVRLDNGKVFSPPDFAPWKRPEKMIIDSLPEGLFCITHSFFCGTDCGLYVTIPNNIQIEQSK